MSEQSFSASFRTISMGKQKSVNSIKTQSLGSIEIDPAKLKVVHELPTPEICKQLQRFLGFANIYHRLIWNRNSSAAVLVPQAQVQLDHWSHPSLCSPERDIFIHSCADSPFTIQAVHRGGLMLWTLEWDPFCLSAQPPTAISTSAPFIFRLNPAEVNYSIRDRQPLVAKIA